MKILTPVQSAYVGGLVDGEGYIGLVVQKRHRDWYYPRVSIANTNARLIEWLNETTGIVCDHTHHHDNEWKDYRQWIVPTDEIVTFLDAVFPYLVIKDDQAITLLEYMEKCHRPRGTVLDDENRYLRAVIYSELQDLNRKGKAVAR